MFPLNLEQATGVAAPAVPDNETAARDAGMASAAATAAILNERRIVNPLESDRIYSDPHNHNFFWRVLMKSTRYFSFPTPRVNRAASHTATAVCMSKRPHSDFHYSQGAIGLAPRR